MNKEKKYVLDAYNKIAKEFKDTRVFTWKWTDTFIEQLPIDSKVLDIGCGTGRNLLYSKVKLTGIDISEEQIKMCKNFLEENTKNNSNNSNNNIPNFLVGDMCDLPFEDNSFDAIICIATFHHLSNEERRNKALEEMKRVLSKNGKILLSVWSINQPIKTRRIFNNYGDTIVPWRNTPRYYYIFTILEIKLLIQKYFKIEKFFWDTGNEIFILIQEHIGIDQSHLQEFP